MNIMMEIAACAASFSVGMSVGASLMLRALREGIARDPIGYMEHVQRWAPWYAAGKAAKAKQ